MRESPPPRSRCGPVRERLDDFRGQDGLELIRIGVLVSQVAKNIFASPHYFQLFAFHRNISFNLFKRSFTRSISRLGLDALRRFLLKRMDNPDVLANLIHEMGRVLLVICRRYSSFS